MIAALCAACAGRPPAPIEDRARAGAGPAASGVYTVVRGDTLYGIAWRYGLDFRRLAALNGIVEPYVIVPGQPLRLHEAAAPVAPRTSESKPRPVEPAQGRAQAPAQSGAGTVVAHNAPSAVSPPVANSAATPVVRDIVPAAPVPNTAAPPAARPAAVPSSASAPAVAQQPRSPAAPAESAADAPVVRWLWPSSGPVVRSFSNTLHKGIDIGGPRGDPVRATAAGRVVYAGSGIAGYGELVILRHNAHYLSAYGHNEQLLVNEGQTVRAGDLIARRGSSGTNSVKLHFEIRRDGQPVDPLTLLPAR